MTKKKNNAKQAPPSLRSFTHCALAEDEATQFKYYTRPRIACADISEHHRLIVNSVPKSGALWMMTLLSHLFRLSPAPNTELYHLSDIRRAKSDHPVFAVVALVRDLRDVVLSWFHEVRRNDLRSGFASARYPTLEAFYFEYLLGYLRCQSRFDNGNLTTWLDFVCAQGFPIIRYEDLHKNTESALHKVMRFWKVDVSHAQIAETVSKCRFTNMANVTNKMGGMLENAVTSGHLHKGQVGLWREEMPALVARDISQRFEEFQYRNGFAQG